MNSDAVGPFCNVVSFPVPAAALKQAIDLPVMEKTAMDKTDFAVFLLLAFIEQSYDLPEGFSLEKKKLYFQLKSALEDK